MEALCPAHNSPVASELVARACRRSSTKPVFFAAPSPSETSAVAKRVVVAPKESFMLASTWSDGREENCVRSLCLGNGKNAYGKQ